MLSSALKKYKGVFIAVTGLAVFFLVYLVINQAIQRQAINSVAFASTVNTVNDKLSSVQPSDEESWRTISAHLGALKDGRAIAELAVEGVGKPQAIDKFLSPENSSIAEVSTAIQSGRLEAARAGMQRINAMVSEKARKRVSLAGILQIVAAILTVLLYVLVIVPVLLRLNQSDETEVSSKKETEGIMSTVSEGLFLLSGDHEIGVEQSASLKTMFKLERDLEGNFFDFILQYVTQDTVNIARDYIELLFGDRVKERLVEDLNPLKQVEINLIRRDGSYENRYLDFKFKRVLVDGKLSHLLGSVTDVSRQVMLEQQLIESKEESEAQIDLLMSILHVDNKQLATFFTSTSGALKHINETLEERGHSDAQIRQKLSEISRDIHKVKGDAAVLNLNNFEFAAHAMEDEIALVQKENKRLSGKLLLPVTTKLRDLFAELDRMKSLMSKFSNAMQDGGQNDEIAQELKEAHENIQLHDPVEEISALSVSVGSAERTIDPPSEMSIDAVSDETLHTSLARLAETVGERNGIKVKFASAGITEESIPDWLNEAVYSTMVQLVRNSVVHGGEAPDVREANGKTPELNIQAQFSAKGDNYSLVVADDGKGVDSEKVVAQAISQGLITAQQGQNIDSRKALTLMFMPGFSSKSDVNLDGGRGVGLDVVLDLTKRHKGKISVKSAKGKFCKFMFTYPVD